MSKFPFLEWVDYYGRDIPVLYPAHQLKNGGYTKTGENNPYPVSNYVLGKKGIWIPQKGTENGSANVDSEEINVRLDNIDAKLNKVVDENGRLRVFGGYVGSSEDIKPLDPSVKEGDLYTETDTGKKYLFDGKYWKEKL